MAKPKQLSNPFSSGGGGVAFENQVQTIFVVLMLTGGVVPCLPPWPIKKIKLQGRNQDYNTDDFIAFTEERSTGRKAKLLAQIKHRISFTENDSTLAEAIQAAWLDFNNTTLFDPTIDAIAVLSGPLTSDDVENVRTILEWARHYATALEFVENIQMGNFSSEGKRKAFGVFRAQLKRANNGVELSDEQLWQFTRCFHVLGYDMDVRSGVTLSLLQSHISQFTNDNASGIWGMVSREVASFNQNAGTMTIEMMSDSVKSAFSKHVEREFAPKDVTEARTDHPSGPAPYGPEQANALALASLVGQWNENAEGDRDSIRKLIEGDD